MPCRSVNESFKKLFITTAECSTQLTNLSPPLPSPFRPQNYTFCEFLRSLSRIQKTQDYVFIDVCNLYILWPRLTPMARNKSLIYIFDITTHALVGNNVTFRLYCTNIIQLFVNRKPTASRRSRFQNIVFQCFFFLYTPNQMARKYYLII